MHSKSDYMEIMIIDEADQVVKKLFKSLPKVNHSLIDIKIIWKN